MTTEQQFDDLVASLPRELTPPLDDWTALSKRLAQTPQLNPHMATASISEIPPLKQAVGLDLVPTERMNSTVANTRWYWLSGAVAAAAVLMVLLVKPAVHAPADSLATQPNVSQDATVWVHQLKQQREQLLARVSQQQLRQLQQVPAGFENWRQQLAIWQQASAQLERALVQQPANRRLLRQYQQLQHQQLKYMNTLTSLSQAYS